MLRFLIYRHRRLLLVLGVLFLGGASVWFVEQFNRDVSFLLGDRRPHVNTNKLERFLKAGQLKAADQETSVLLVQALQLQTHQKIAIAPNQIKQLPCADLQAIDRLWVKYSRGHFGFSVQKHIFETISETPTEKELNALVPKPTKKLSPEQAFYQESEWQTSRELLKKTWKMNRFSDRVGRGLHQKTPLSLKAPAGHLPSWGVYLKQPYSNLSPFSTPEFVQRQKWCRF